MKNPSHNLRYLIKEMIPVILGILIALFVNNYVEEQNQEKYLQKVMSSITVEFKENVSELETNMAAHIAFIDLLDDRVDEEDLSLGDLLNETNGIELVSIKNTTAQTLLNSNIHLTDFTQVSPLVDIQEGKTHLMAIHRELIRFIYSNLDATDTAKKYILRSVLNDIIHSEENLLEAHRQFLGSVKE
ncbi:MAG: hypothetical protein HKN79_08875 [Flavobacteriales bacterium]|nr:hypothetical protein [Flavobacteriales bacterium]